MDTVYSGRRLFGLNIILETVLCPVALVGRCPASSTGSLLLSWLVPAGAYLILYY